MKTKIYIPHLHYTVYIKPIEKSPEANVKKPYAITYYGKNDSIVYIKLPIKPVDVPTLAHELIHVLQNISEARGINFIAESEHFAYIMQYLLKEILGYNYITK